MKYSRTLARRLRLRRWYHLQAEVGILGSWLAVVHVTTNITFAIALIGWPDRTQGAPAWEPMTVLVPSRFQGLTFLAGAALALWGLNTGDRRKVRRGLAFGSALWIWWGFVFLLGAIGDAGSLTGTIMYFHGSIVCALVYFIALGGAE